LFVPESAYDDCLHCPSCSVLASHLVAGASEGVIPSGCTPVAPYNTSATAPSLLTPVQPSSYRRLTMRAGGRAFPSEQTVAWSLCSLGPATMPKEERQRWGAEAGREAPRCME